MFLSRAITVKQMPVKIKTKPPYARHKILCPSLGRSFI